MKPVKGFIANDGRFFEDAAAAEYHEARAALYQVLDETETDNGRYVDPDKFIEILVIVMPEIERLVNAWKANPESADQYEDAIAAARPRVRDAILDEGKDPVQGNGAAPPQGRPYRARREVPPGVQQLASGRYEPVSDVGSGERTEDVQDRS